jgi:hypothetical protein
MLLIIYNITYAPVQLLFLMLFNLFLKNLSKELGAIADLGGINRQFEGTFVVKEFCF